MSSLSSPALPIRLVRIVAKAASLLCRGILALMVLHIVIDVLCRYAFNIALPGTIAFVSNYYMIAIIFLPLATAEIERRHIEVEVLTQALPSAFDAFLRLAGWLIAAVIFSMMSVESWKEASRAYSIGSFIIEHGYRIPVWISYYMLPVGFVAVAVVCLTRFVLALLSLKQGITRAVSRAENAFGKGSGDV